MSEDLEREMEKASLLKNRFYLILNNTDSDSFSMTAYDTTEPDTVDLEDVPAGMVILSGLIEMLENDFERVWNAGMARVTFINIAESFRAEFENEEDAANLQEVTDKVIEREDNIVKVNFGEKQ
tara:strand:- start:1526 stop:1897 length:372 start_codon:yes stop_codon:yes gene_type:complete